MFRKILIANRGEIAVRIARTCRAMGVRTAAVFSEPDRGSLHVRLADEAYPIGPAPSRESYLDIDRILDAARRSGVDAVHPGYGFLSENAAFAEAVERAGLAFIGPSASAIAAMASKTGARRLMEEAGVPVVPGHNAPLDDPEQARQAASEIGYPLMLKASAGGGGKGMRLVRSSGEFDESLEQARSEARAAFGDDSVYIEKAIERPRHVEVQVLGDRFGNVLHLGERECSLQRRHQKVVEETPSPLLVGAPEVREALTAAAVRAAEAVAYSSAGTIEFLMDAERRFYFLEMNTRLQVEHPVTEWATGLDLVREQIRVAAGEALGFAQSDVSLRGCAIECRVYAEDPENAFLPSPGRITSWAPPAGPFVRVDSGAYSGWEASVHYDPLLAKLAVWGATRAEAIGRLRTALREFHVGGVRTTLDLFRRLVEDPEFQRGEFDTGFLDRFLAGERRAEPLGEAEAAVLAAAGSNSSAKAPEQRDRSPSAGPWKLAARRRAAGSRSA